MTGFDGSSNTQIKESYILVGNLLDCPFKNTVDNPEYINTLYKLRDKHFNNFYGKFITSIYYRNAKEVSSILSANPELQARFREIVEENIGLAEELTIEGTAYVPQEKADAIKVLLNDIAKEGSLGLKLYTAFVIKGIEYRFLTKGIGVNID